VSVPASDFILVPWYTIVVGLIELALSGYTDVRRNILQA
jgi:hypothetical protein